MDKEGTENNQNEAKEVKNNALPVPRKMTDLKKNTENPFMEQALQMIDKNIVKRYKSATQTDQKATLIAVDPSTGDVLGSTRFVRQIEVDEEQFTKLYLSNFKAFFDLSQPAIRVFGYIISKCLHPKNDMFVFIPQYALDYTGYKSTKDLYKGLFELAKAEIIARGPAENVWFLNPMVCFNGDRVTFAKTYVRKRKTTTDDPNQLTIDFKEE